VIRDKHRRSLRPDPEAEDTGDWGIDTLFEEDVRPHVSIRDRHGCTRWYGPVVVFIVLPRIGSTSLDLLQQADFADCRKEQNRSRGGQCYQRKVRRGAKGGDKALARRRNVRHAAVVHGASCGEHPSAAAGRGRPRRTNSRVESADKIGYQHTNPLHAGVVEVLARGKAIADERRDVWIFPTPRKTASR